jgi:transposase
MDYKTGIDRNQANLLPESLEDYVTEDNICRVIDAFVDKLDMVKLKFKYAITSGKGCPPYDPRAMLKLYLYGFLNGIRSSRKFETETIRNVEVMWLMNKLTPDDRTICNFRSDNKEAIKSTFRVFSKMCNDWGLYGKTVIAVDGTKIRANNSRKNNHQLDSVKKQLEWLEKKITEYMTALDENDKADQDETKPNAEQIKEILKKLTKKKLKFARYLSQIEANDGKEISTIDKDSRLMKQGGSAGFDVCYNVQSVFDSENKLIVDFDITNSPSDRGELYKMTESAKEIMEVSNIIALADKGYYESADIVKCETNGTECLVAKPQESHQTEDENYFRDKFRFDSEKNIYICPQGMELKFMRLEKKREITHGVYANYAACRVCPNKDKCTKTKKGREISRSEFQGTMDIVDKRTKKYKTLYKQRQEIVEHPFGTVKKIWGFGRFFCRGKQKVTAETSLAFLAYNFRRVVNIQGVEKMIISLG